MGEATCLRRSFSNPSEISHDFSKGDPMRALGESISFGRYMSETLDWEKWSTFSQNRYLEEAEKSSKPGSVAKMKAYFEAHYKKIGAKKQAALEQANDAGSYVETEVVDGNNIEPGSTLSSSPLNQVTAPPDSHLTVNEFPKQEIHSIEPLSIPSVVISSRDSTNPTKESLKEEASIVESISDLDFKDSLPLVQEQQFEDAKVIAIITESCVDIKETQPIDAMKDNIIPNTPEKQVIAEVEDHKEVKDDKLDPVNMQKLADSSLRSAKKSNMSKLSSSLARLATPVRPKKEGTDKSTTHKSAMKSVEKKKSTSKMIQMSININSDVKPVMRVTPASHKTAIGRAFTPLSKMIRQSFFHTPAQSTSRASVNSISRRPSATPMSETRRSRIVLEKSFTSTRTSDQKMQSPYLRNKNSPAPSPITFSPFNFQTEERAAKRKEFFERRMEKVAENLKLLDQAKVKSKADSRKLSQSVNFSKAAINIKKEVLSDKAKIPFSRAQPPKAKTIPSTNLERGKPSQPPQSDFDSKLASANSKSIPATLPTIKKRHENTSPNII